MEIDELKEGIDKAKEEVVTSETHIEELQQRVGIYQNTNFSRSVHTFNIPPAERFDINKCRGIQRNKRLEAAN